MIGLRLNLVKLNAFLYLLQSCSNQKLQITVEPLERYKMKPNVKMKLNAKCYAILPLIFALARPQSLRHKQMHIL